MENETKRYVVVIGARPNFVKAAAFFREAKNHPEFHFTLIHTGQHFDDSMSKVFFDQMEIPRPDINLNIKGKFHTEKLGKMFSELKNIFEKRKFDGVIVFGDINSTLAAAVAATKYSPLIHIESGLRSHDRRMPEEINRVIIDHLSELLFTTEPEANRNLLLEGILEEKIEYVGNIMIESMEIFGAHIDNSDILRILKLSPKKYIVATLHRQENTDAPHIFEKLLNILNVIGKNRLIVFSMHPGTKKKIEVSGYGPLLSNVRIIEPLGYFDFMKLVKESGGIITDSGGIQEETTHLGIPCATIRDNTERPITVTHGSNKLFPIDMANPKDILDHLSRRNFQSRYIPLWDRDVSKRIFARLKKIK